MSTADPTQTNPFENPLVRHAIGFSGAIVIAFIAVFFLEGIAMYLALGLAVVDAVAVPKLLERTVDEDESA